MRCLIVDFDAEVTHQPALGQLCMKINTVDDYIRWYKEKRIKISLGSLSLIEYRESLGLTA